LILGPPHVDSEWYFSFEILEPILSQTFGSESCVLELGCGDSPLAPKLSSAGHTGMKIA
jgi:hypothetical protein